METTSHYEIVEVCKSGTYKRVYQKKGTAINRFDLEVERAIQSWDCGAKYIINIKLFENGEVIKEWDGVQHDLDH
ncbi:hypothetical protein KAR91_32780 [Candidatus Pacearchaeota archaeon]|nr:hypothetical protein [Candidatus Pacearchaeota archaeon]